MQPLQNFRKSARKLEKTERSLKVSEQKKLTEADKLEEINTKIQSIN